MLSTCHQPRVYEESSLRLITSTSQYLSKITSTIQRVSSNNHLYSRMSQFVCGISGETVEEPVVSQVSGTVYEKRLIHKWIQENGTDPGILGA